VTESGPFTHPKLITGAIVATTTAVVTWYSSPLSGVQGATNVGIAAVVTLGSFFLGLLAIDRLDPSWYSSQ